MAYLQFDGVDERVELAPQDRQPLRREAPRDREPARGRHRRHPRRHRRERRQQRSGRAHRRVRDRERRQDHRRQLPAGELHRPRRGHLRRGPRERSATRSATSRTTCKTQTGVTEPLRDWFPLSAHGPVQRSRPTLCSASPADWGSIKCGCHPNCGIGTVLFVNKKTKQMVPLLDVPRPRGAPARHPGHHRRRRRAARSRSPRSRSRCSRTSDAEKAPAGLQLPRRCCKQFLSQTGARGKKIGEHESDANEFEWRVLFVAGMWFQDLFNYDFRRTEMCIIPYGTQMGEISFCAYNTGVGWRQIIEKMKADATVAEWYRSTAGTRSTRRTRTCRSPANRTASWSPRRVQSDACRSRPRRTEQEERKVGRRREVF